MAAVRSAGAIGLLLLVLLSAAAVEGSWREEQARDRVQRVPGQGFNTSYAQYAGYVTVSEPRAAALFYWFFEAEKDPGSKPLVLWLNGGPGCSSIAYGLGEEVGPFHVNADGKGVHVNPYSWNKGTSQLNKVLSVNSNFSLLNNKPHLRQQFTTCSEFNFNNSIDSLFFGVGTSFPIGILVGWYIHYGKSHNCERVYLKTLFSLAIRKKKRFSIANLLFVDSPVGVGYSYSNTSDEILRNGDARTAKDSLAFLLKWLERFPQYKGREFYLTGESYAGHYVPQLAQAIKRYHEATGDKSINLKGYMVGNALTDDFHDHYGIFQFMWTTGLISDQTYKLLNIFCDFQSFVHTSPQCDKILDIASKEAGNIDSYSIFTPTCHATFASSKNKVMKRLRSVGKMAEQYDPCTEKHSTVYFNLAEVQKALHVNPVIGKSKWATCSGVVNNHWGDCERSVLHIYHELIQYGLRIWVFSGDTDAVIPVTSTRYSIDALKLPTVTPWHAWYDDDGEVGGWSQGYRGLTFVTVRGAGHEVPLHRPKQALTLIKSFLAGSPMPMQSSAHSDM